MHAALNLRDVLHEIFEHLTPLPEPLDYEECCPDREGQRVLYNAALTCKAFSEPALKHLWTHVPTIDAILGLFPSAKLVPSTYAVDDGDLLVTQPRGHRLAWIMERLVTDAERVRFSWYAQHIHTLHLYTASCVDPSVFLNLLRSRLETPLAPHLRVLFAASQRLPYCDMAITLFAGPTLRSLTLAFASDRDEFLPFVGARDWYAPRLALAEVAIAAPALEHLTVYLCADAALLEPIGAIRGLRSLDLSTPRIPFGMPLLRALAQLEELEELELSNTFDEQGATPCRGFKKLRHLTVIDGIRTVPALLGSLPDLRLHELRLANATCEEMAPIKALAAALRAGAGEELEELCLEYLTGGPVISNAPLSALLEPFFPLQNLRRFIMDTDQILNIQNTDLRNIGLAWPKLEKLRVEWAVEYRRVLVAPSIRGIVVLAKRCPRLDEVYFSAVVPAVNTMSTAAPLKVAKFSRKTFDICVPDEKIRDIEQLARVLHSAIGRLHINDFDKEEFGRWNAVLEQMTRLQDK